MGAPNAVWSADFTGHFKTDDRYGSPLTSTDGDSRFRLSCRALSSTSVAAAKLVCTRVFKAFGLPQRIHTDHGVPFATNTLGRLSPLSARWVRLGLLPACSDPGNPPPHGHHARRHRPRKSATTRPPGANRRAPAAEVQARPRIVDPCASACGARQAYPRRLLCARPTGQAH